MMKPIKFEKCRCIVEYGAGTGVFTKEMIKRKNDDTLLLIIEQDDTFYGQLKDEFGKLPGVNNADYIVSGLPFTSLPRELSMEILQNTKSALGGKGKFITFQYTLFRKSLFLQYFHIEHSIREYRNLPPAYVISMQLV